jgi:hypothetical protein
MKLRVAHFNVENLFGRARVFNLKDHTIGDKILERIDNNLEISAVGIRDTEEVWFFRVECSDFTNVLR